MTTDLAVIEAALKAATPGPWEASPDNLVPGLAAVLTAWCHEGEDAELVTDWCEIPDAHLIANAPTWLAELVERVKAAEAEVERLQSELQDFAEYGARHDTTPTICGNPDAIWWYGYIQSMDRGVRERARRALATPDSAAHAQAGADAPSDERNRFSGEDTDEPTQPILRPTDQRYEPPADDHESGCCR